MQSELSAETPPKIHIKQHIKPHLPAVCCLVFFMILFGILIFSGYGSPGNNTPGSPVSGLLIEISDETNKVFAGEADWKTNETKASILFLGDMMFDRGVRAQISTHGFEYIFGPATTTIAAHDLTVANLEGPITSSNSLTYVSNGTGGKKAISGFQFTFPLATAAALKNAGIDIVSLANNHTNNFAQTGLDETRIELAKANVGYFGSPANSDSFMATSTCVGNAGTVNAREVASTSAGDSERICLGLIGWHEFASASKDDSTVFTSIQAMRSSVDYLVIFPHWGAEYEAKPTADQRSKAESWLDAGADAVIGAHPHVVETIEQYNGKPIFYSLGNFIFDQYFSFDTTHGVGVSIELTKNNTVEEGATGGAANISASYTLIPFSSVGSHVSIPNASSTERLYGSIKRASDANVTTWLKFK